MVDDVELDYAVEDVFADEAEFAVDCGGGTLQKGPGLLVIFGNFRMCVVEVGDGDDPVVDPHIWLQI